MKYSIHHSLKSNSRIHYMRQQHTINSQKPPLPPSLLPRPRKATTTAFLTLHESHRYRSRCRLLSRFSIPQNLGPPFFDQNNLFLERIFFLKRSRRTGKNESASKRQTQTRELSVPRRLPYPLCQSSL